MRVGVRKRVGVRTQMLYGHGVETPRRLDGSTFGFDVMRCDAMCRGLGAQVAVFYTEADGMRVSESMARMRYGCVYETI